MATLRAEPIAGLTEGLGAEEENEPIAPPTTGRLLFGFGVGVGGGTALPLFAGLVDVFPDELHKYLFPLGAIAMGVVAVAIQLYAGESSSRQRVRRLFSRTLLVIVLALVVLGWLVLQRVERIDLAGGEVASFAIARDRQPETICPCDPDVSDNECLRSLTANQALINRCWSRNERNKVRGALLGSYLLLTSGLGGLIGLLLLQRVAKKQAATRKRSRAPRKRDRTVTPRSEPPLTAAGSAESEPPPQEPVRRRRRPVRR